MISYAQNFEDVMLARALGDRASGFYVDIGACFPDTASVTRHFYELGWRGVNVEPMAVPFAALEAARGRDVNVRAAIADRDGEIAIYAGPSVGESTAVRPFDTAQPIMVPCMTLASLCRKHVAQPIDFLKIDVEGLERDVVEGGDWIAFRPTIVLIEVTLPWSTQRREDAAPIAAFMRSHGYDEVYFDGLNAFFLARESAALASRFSAPPNVLDRFTLANEAAQQATAARLQAHADSVEKRLDEVRQQADTVTQRLGEVQAHAEREQAALRESIDARERVLVQAQREAQERAARLDQLHAEFAATTARLHDSQLDAERSRRLLQQRLARVVQAAQARIARVTALSNARVAREMRASKRRVARLAHAASVAEERLQHVEAALVAAEQAAAQAHAEFKHAASVAGQAQAQVTDLHARERAAEARHRETMFRALQGEHTIASMRDSRSWRVTAPLRAIGDWFRGGARNAASPTAAVPPATTGTLRAAALRRGRMLAKRTPLYHWLAPRLKARYPGLWARARSVVVEHPAPAPVAGAHAAASVLASPPSGTAMAAGHSDSSVESIAARIRHEIARRRGA